MELQVSHDPAHSPYAGMSWQRYNEIAAKVTRPFEDKHSVQHFDYVHPLRLQTHTPQRLRKPYPVRVAYLSWGRPSAPPLVCTGGVANTAQRFNYLALNLSENCYVACLDWLGRGQSGWLAAEKDYALETYVEQVLQLIAHLGRRSVVLLGSSLGGSVAIEVAARHPELVERIILNDIGPYIPAKRRRRRAQTLARHYVFRTPADMFRKTGASQKHDGPVSDDVRLNGSYHQTRWSQDEDGRIYRHDIRALQAYQAQARGSLNQWKHWEKIRCPVLVIHGMESDALLPHTVARMRKHPEVTMMHVPRTGHTPVLAESNHIACIREWLRPGSMIAGDFCSDYSPPPAGAERRADARPII